MACNVLYSGSFAWVTNYDKRDIVQWELIAKFPFKQSSLPSYALDFEMCLPHGMGIIYVWVHAGVRARKCACLHLRLCAHLCLRVCVVSVSHAVSVCRCVSVCVGALYYPCFRPRVCIVWVSGGRVSVCVCFYTQIFVWPCGVQPAIVQSTVLQTELQRWKSVPHQKFDDQLFHSFICVRSST